MNNLICILIQGQKCADSVVAQLRKDLCRQLTVPSTSAVWPIKSKYSAFMVIPLTLFPYSITSRPRRKAFSLFIAVQYFRRWEHILSAPFFSLHPRPELQCKSWPAGSRHYSLSSFFFHIPLIHFSISRICRFTILLNASTSNSLIIIPAITTSPMDAANHKCHFFISVPSLFHRH